MGSELEIKAGISRRDFVKFCIISSLNILSYTLPSFGEAKFLERKKGLIKPHHALFYKSLPNKNIQCTLCPRKCFVSLDNVGYCQVRKNIDGKYYSLVYGNPCAVHIDPIEKKPLFHVLPASKALSIATTGCNLDCKFCQNWTISQTTPDKTYNYDLSPSDIVSLAKRYECASIAYTYVEPTIFYEYMIDTCVIAKENHVLNVYHSNGFINELPLTKLAPLMDAANIDLKGFTNEYYKNMSEGLLLPVLNTLKTLKKLNVHLEITNLVIPGQNDDMSTIRSMCVWIKKELGEDVPLHFSRFYPMYKLKNLPPTPVSSLEKARKTAMDVGLHFVYIGNVPGSPGEHTYCPKCKQIIIRRIGYQILDIHIKEGKCEYCGREIPGIWEV